MRINPVGILIFSKTIYTNVPLTLLNYGIVCVFNLALKLNLGKLSFKSIISCHNKSQFFPFILNYMDTLFCSSDHCSDIIHDGLIVFILTEANDFCMVKKVLISHFYTLHHINIIQKHKSEPLAFFHFFFQRYIITLHLISGNRCQRHRNNLCVFKEGKIRRIT
jgi:hypothetical protein